MIEEYKQKIDCCVRDCVHCIDGCHCNLEKIQITKDIRNENIFKGFFIVFCKKQKHID